MARFKVFHNRNFLEMTFSPLLNQKTITKEEFADNFRGHLDMVAEVEAEEMGDVYRITNNIDRSWVENPEVLATTKPEGCRSTSVGDVVVEAETERQFVCAMVGWVEVV